MPVIIDQLVESVASMEAGQITELRRVGLITGYQDPGGNLEITLLRLLADPQLPKFGSTVQARDLTLYLRDASLRFVDGNRAEFELIYNGWPLKYTGGTTLIQIEDMRDRSGEQITVSHANETQGGFIRVQIPQTTLRTNIVHETNDPVSFKKTWIGYVNSDIWQGGQPGTWLVTDVQFECLQFVAEQVYLFSFEFQDHPDTQQPEVVFIDPTTNQPPANLVAGEGTKRITYYPSRNFGGTFPTP